ncbi:MAG: family 43 glycosylhydrolase [Roseburia sp.]|nr:family 43 glycosylhydrolase [Roseburia sp.]
MMKRAKKGRKGKRKFMNQMTEYKNPFILERADPYIIKGPDGYYYFTASYPMKSDNDSEGYDRVILRRAERLKDLSTAEELTIWKTSDESVSHRFIWAPEIHYIAGKWYIFYAGSSELHNRWAIDCHVLECLSSDPCKGEWVERGKFQKREDDSFSFTGFSLDMTYFEACGKSYCVWAQQNEQRISCLYIGQVDAQKPYRLISKPMLLSSPEYDWERVRFPVNEGPAVIQHEGRIFVCYSASGTGPEYCVGMLEASEDEDLLSRKTWKKQDKPFLRSEDLVEEYGPGHNSFTQDEEGNDIFVYHARSRECFEKNCGYAQNDPLYDPCRHARLRRLAWRKDGKPVLL